MTVKKPAKKKRAGRPVTFESPRVSIAARLQTPLHERIKRDAENAGWSVSREIERRLERSFEWEEQFGSIKQLHDDAQRVINRGREGALAQWGIKPVAGRRGLYFEGDSIPDDLVALNPALETLIERAAERAVEMALKQVTTK